MNRRRPSAKAGVWHYEERGSGRPLVLLHGLGMSHAAWSAVMHELGRTRRVIAFDIAGFGLTPPLAPGTAPTVVNLVDRLEWSLRELGVELPVDIVGNSLGAAMAIEAGRRGIGRSVVALAPTGLWRSHPAPHVKYVFATLRLGARYVPRLVKTMMKSALLRELMLAVPLSVGSARMSVRDAQRTVDDLAASTAFDETFAATLAPLPPTQISVPVTVVFGTRDWILPKGSQHRDALPAHTRWIRKAGWGHVPMWAYPAGVSRVILEGTKARSVTSDRTAALTVVA